MEMFARPFGLGHRFGWNGEYEECKSEGI